MTHPRSAFRSSPTVLMVLLLMLAGILPLLSQILAYFCLLLMDSSAWFSRDLVLSEGITLSRSGLLQITRWFCLAVFCLGLLAMGHAYGRYARLPRQQLWRYIPFLLFILYAHVVCMLVLSPLRFCITGLLSLPLDSLLSERTPMVASVSYVNLYPV